MSNWLDQIVRYLEAIEVVARVLGKEAAAKEAGERKKRVGGVKILGSPANDREETLFLRVLGNKSPVLRILDFLIDSKAYDYIKVDIAKGAGISRRALSSAWESLEKNGLAKETRKAGRAKKYKIDLGNPVVRKFIELDNAICELYASQIAEQAAVEDSRDRKASQRPLLV